MFEMLRKYFRYRRLRPIVTAMPRRLAQAFGRSETYTLLQAKRVIADLQLVESAEPYALAATCSYDELEKGKAGLTAERYRLLRHELAELFDLPSGFTMAHLSKRSFSQHHPAPENPYASGGSHGV
jgi:hypothetical protein